MGEESRVAFGARGIRMRGAEGAETMAGTRFEPKFSESDIAGVYMHEDIFDVDLAYAPRQPLDSSTPGGKVEPVRRRPHDRRLVTLGDSLTHGFHHFAIHDTTISWPAIVAEKLGLSVGSTYADGFRVPDYPRPGGYPLNLEELVRLDLPNFGTPAHMMEYLETVKNDYAPTSAPVWPEAGSPPNDNLAVWGWDVRDLLERTVKTELDAMHEPPSPGFTAAAERFIGKVLHQVDSPDRRSGITVLAEPDNTAPNKDERTVLDLVVERGHTETLAIWIGANNVLSSVYKFVIVPSEDDGYMDLAKKDAYSVWRPKHFKLELDRLEAKVADIDADHVLWATVPHVTIPPLAHGIEEGEYGGRLAENQRYFRYYTQPWIGSRFSLADPYLTGEEAWLIDSVIDAYNDLLVEMVRRQRSENGKDWRIVDMCAVLDRLAWRRNDAAGGKSYPYLTEYELPQTYKDRGYNTQFLAVDPESGTVTRGGLIGLDGIHPTTAAYGLVAHEFLKEMREAGVTIDPDDPNASVEPDWNRLLARDTLLSAPPKRINEALDVLGNVEHHFDMVKGVWDAGATAVRWPVKKADSVN